MAEANPGQSIKSAPIPRPRIGGTVRKHNDGKGDVLVRNIETGAEAFLSRANARDLCEHAGGWKVVSDGVQRNGEQLDIEREPAGAAGAGGEDTGPGGEGGEGGEGGAGSGGAPDPALEELNALRATLTDLGGEVDQRWGKKRLNEEIAKKKPAA